MVSTCAKSAEQDQLTLKLLDLQIKVQDIFKTSDKWQLIKNAEKVLDDLEPEKLRELQNTDQSIINLQNSRKQSVIADKDNILRMKVDYKLDILEWHEKWHLPSHIQLQDLQNGITQPREIHELTPRNWHSANALPCNGHNRNKRCWLSIQIYIYTHRHVD